MKKRITIIVLTIIIIIHSIIFFIPIINEDKGVKTYGFSAFNAVKYNEEPKGNKLKLTVVWVREAKNLKVDDLIIIKDNKTGTVEYWVEKVVSIENEEITLRTADSDFEEHQVNQSEVIGNYIKDANVIETVYYVNIQWVGYILSNLILFGLLIMVIFSKPLKDEEVF